MLQENISKTNDNFDQYKERLSNFSGEFELGLFIYIARRSILWVLLFFCTSLFIAYTYLRYTPPVYESTGVIQLQSSNQANKLLNIENFSGETDNGLAEGVEVLRSRVFLKRVLAKLPLEISYYTEGTFRANELYKSSPYSVEIKTNNEKITGTKIYVDFKDNKQGIISFDFAGKKHSKTYETGVWVRFPDIEIKLNIENYSEIENQQNLVKQNAYYFIVKNIDGLVDEYFPQLDVKLMNEQAKTIIISFKDFNPQKAADIVSKMSEEYSSFDKEHKGESSKSVIGFIDSQLEMVYAKLKLSENDIQTFKKNYNVNADVGLASSNFERLNFYEDQITSMELETNVLDKIEKNINNSKSIDTFSLLAMLSGTSSESAVSSTVETLHRLLVQKEDMLTVAKPNSQDIKLINDQIVFQENLLKASLKSVKENLEIKKQNLIKKSSEFENKNDKLPENEIEYGRLQRLFSINEKYYTLLLEKKTEYAITNAGFVSQSIELEKAVPANSPVSPNRRVTYLIFALISLLLSLILILVRYLSHNVINSLNEITKHTNASISILGIVPKAKQDIPVSQLLVDKNPKSLIAEAFRSVRTNLQFISNEPGPKIMALTSTISGEGKTFVAINLAGIIAYSGKKVIILDLDMRKPKIHIGFNVQNSIGMSTLLIGKDSIESAIQHSSLENLDFITAGPIPPNPSELIISLKMDEILALLKTKYDVVIIDNPPVGLVSDGITMIQKADYPIYIFRADYSKRNFIQNVDRLFNESNIKKLSVILNGVDVERNNYGYNYGYGYGYGYGSSYGYYDDEKRSKHKVSLSEKLKSFFGL